MMMMMMMMMINYNNNIKNDGNKNTHNNRNTGNDGKNTYGSFSLHNTPTVYLNSECNAHKDIKCKLRAFRRELQLSKLV
jgi:hypothetical protein